MRAAGRLAIGALLACGVGCLPPPGLRPSATRLPEVPLVQLDGARASLAAELDGQPALISLWATWCEACRAELGALQRLADRTVGDGVVLGVAVGERREAVARFARERQLGFARLVDEGFGLAEALGIDRLPTTLVVDHEGRIAFVGGALDAAALERYRAVMSAWPGVRHGRR